MIIGVPKEIKNNENRVSLTPGGVFTLTQAGHQVLVETNAGGGSGFSDESYISCGAHILEHAEDVWLNAKMIMKVKEPQESEYAYFRKDTILFTYLHLAAEKILTKTLMDSGVTAIAYETIEVNHNLPLLAPMSEIAGRMATQIGAQFLEKAKQGKGILLGAIPGVKRGTVTIIGGGSVGTNSAKMAVGLGANVTIIDVNLERLRHLDDLFGNKINTLVSNPFNIAQSVADADLLIGAVLIPGAKAPTLVPRELIKTMEKGSVVIDVAIDQGGIIETCDRVTTHDDPIYIKEGIIHYAVANMPGAVPRTSTIALTNATLPYAMKIAGNRLEELLTKEEAIRKGVNVYQGNVTNEAVAHAHNFSFVALDNVLGTNCS